MANNTIPQPTIPALTTPIWIPLRFQQLLDVSTILPNNQNNQSFVILLSPNILLPLISRSYHLNWGLRSLRYASATSQLNQILISAFGMFLSSQWTSL